jgi:hypothetical protein
MYRIEKRVNFHTVCSARSDLWSIDLAFYRRCSRRDESDLLWYRVTKVQRCEDTIPMLRSFKLSHIRCRLPALSSAL